MIHVHDPIRQHYLRVTYYFQLFCYLRSKRNFVQRNCSIWVRGIDFVSVILNSLHFPFFIYYLEEVIKNRKRLKTHLNRDISFYAAALKIPVTCWMWLIASVTKDLLMSNRPAWAILCKTITIIWSPFTYKCFFEFWCFCMPTTLIYWSFIQKYSVSLIFLSASSLLYI